MKIILAGILFVLPQLAQAQVDSVSVVQQTQIFQKELNHEYKAKATSPLMPANLRKFKKHDYFPITVSYAVMANLTFTPDAPFTPMAATGPVVNEYRSFALAKFELDGQSCELTLYQSKILMNNAEYKDYLFLPFTDKTTGSESYGGGRYLELRIPKEGNTILINFNLAYNPYCAYNTKYSCPLVPQENDLPVAVMAGVRYK